MKTLLAFPHGETGVRYRPNEIFSVDAIYGHNIMGENANWMTIGTTIRKIVILATLGFEQSELEVPRDRLKKPARERSGHL